MVVNEPAADHRVVSLAKYCAALRRISFSSVTSVPPLAEPVQLRPLVAAQRAGLLITLRVLDPRRERAIGHAKRIGDLVAGLI